MTEAKATIRLAPGPEAISAARDAVTSAVQGRIDDERLETLRLLVSEVVTNSVRHSGTRRPLELSMSFNGEVRVAVTDNGVGFTPGLRGGGVDEVGGWGLYLVDQLSSRWGVARNSHTCVWFKVPVR